jgi:hypothetical protein
VVDWTEIASIATGVAALATACAAGATLWMAHKTSGSIPYSLILAQRRQACQTSKCCSAHLVGPSSPCPTGARVISPLSRPRKNHAGRLGCPKVPGSMRNRDRSLIAGTGKHDDDKACCLKTVTFKAAYAPQSYQTPIWGTLEWEAKYAKRTNVERGYSTVKNPDVIGLKRGLFHMRGLPSFSLLVTCAWIAHNLYLRLKALDADVKAQRVVAHTRRKHRRRNRVPLSIAGGILSKAASAIRPTLDP